MKNVTPQSIRETAAEGLFALRHGTGPAATREVAWTGKFIETLDIEPELMLISAAFALRNVQTSGSTDCLPEVAARVVTAAVTRRELREGRA